MKVGIQWSILSHEPSVWQLSDFFFIPVGGITDLVENNVNGILIEPGNKKQLYEAILFLIDHPEYLSKMGHQSGKKAEKFYPPAIEKQLDHLYQSLEK